MHPSSVLMGAGCEYVCYHELVWTKKRYMRGCMKVEADWVREMKEKEGGESAGQANASTNTSGQARGVMTEHVLQRLAGSDGSAAKRERENEGGAAVVKRPKVILHLPRKGG